MILVAYREVYGLNCLDVQRTESSSTATVPCKANVLIGASALAMPMGESLGVVSFKSGL